MQTLETLQASQIAIADIRTAYFHQYSNGTRFLKIRNQYGWLDLIDLTNAASLEWSKRRNPRLIDVINHCLAFGFQHDTYAIDNRNEAQYMEDWISACNTACMHGLSVQSYEAWRDRQTLAF